MNTKDETIVMDNVMYYSTMSGELPRLVREGIPKTMVAWTDYVTLQRKYEALIADSSGQSILEITPQDVDTFGAGVDRCVESFRSRKHKLAEFGSRLRKVVFTEEDKKAIYLAYSKWANQLFEDLEDKSSITADELVYKVLSLVEENLK